MQLSHAITSFESAVDTQLRLAGPDVADAGAQLLAALSPAIRQTMLDVVAMAVTEISSQLDGQVVDIKLVDGEPDLVVRAEGRPVPPPPPPPPGAEESDEARITLRLPSYLKDIITAAAESSGDSVNSYVVDVLGTSARKSKRSSGAHTRTTLEL